MPTEYDWSRFTKRIDVKASPEKLYNAWATRSGIESWFLRLGEFSTADGLILANDKPVQKGIKYTWRWHGHNDDATEHGEIIEANGIDLLVFSFGATMKVRVQVKVEEATNIVELEQYDIPTDEKGKTNFHLGCAEGWVFYLANLKSVMEGGIDLRNKNEHIRRVINS